MNGSIEVQCADQTVAAWLRDWVAGLALAPPVSLAIRVTVQERLDGTPDAREPFRQPLVEIRSGPPHGDVRIRWTSGEAVGVIAPGGREAHVTLTPAALENRERLSQSFLVTVLIFLLRRTGWHHVHGAGARDPRGRDWLFAGDAEAGKSTTAALLSTLGWGVGTDDLTFLAAAPDGVDAIAPHLPIALRQGGYDLLGLAGGAEARGGRKRAFFPDQLGGRFEPRVRPTILALPRVDGAVTRVEPVSPGTALAELVRWSAWVALEPELAQGHLDLLAALARQARCYRVALGPDLFGGRDLLMELIP